MKVKKMMTKDPGVCTIEQHLSEAAEIMRSRDCGVVPIVDENGLLKGLTTDRDICLAVSKFDRKPSEIRIAEMIDGKVYSCAASDKIEKALSKMKKRRIKRLPVVDKDNKLVGVLSLSDFLNSKKLDKSLMRNVFSTLKAIGKPKKRSKPERIVLNEIAV